MQNALHIIIFLDKFRRQLTNKSITNQLILPAIIVALIAAPMAACANSNLRNGNGQVNTIRVTPTPSSRSSNPTTPIQSIHMLDKTHGWALASMSEHLSKVLKTSDGGLHWQDVTPTNGSIDKAFFLNDQDAWGISLAIQPNSTPTLAPSGLPANNLINVLRTTNGGQSWQSSTIQSGTVLDAYPFFLNASDGWLQTSDEQGMGGQVPSRIFQTTDGGQHWNQLGNTYPGSELIQSSGISFNNAQNGWESGIPGAGGAQPIVDVTHDGGQTWHSLSLPTPPGASPDSQVQAVTPPVFFGKDGVLPIKGSGIDLYVTHNAGQTWTPTKAVTSNGQGSLVIDIIDMQYIWVAVGTNISVTSDGGQSWTKLPSTPQAINGLNFVDPNNGWAITPTELLHTTDGGRTWQLINYSIAPSQKR